MIKNSNVWELVVVANLFLVGAPLIVNLGWMLYLMAVGPKLVDLPLWVGPAIALGTLELAFGTIMYRAYRLDVKHQTRAV